MIVLGLIQNIALLVTLTVVHQLILRMWGRSSLSYNLLSGLLYGSVAIVGIMTSVAIAPGIVFDGRSIVIAIAGFFGGPFVAAISAAMTIAYRLHLGGAGALMGVLVVAEAAVLGSAFYLLRQRLPWLASAPALYAFGVLVHLVMLVCTLALPDRAWRTVLPEIALPVMALYPVAVVLIGRLLLDQEERLGAEQALRESETRLRAVVEQTDQGISLGKPDGTIAICNDAMERISGYSREEVERHGWFDLVYPTPERRAEAIALAGKALAGGLPYVEVPIVRKDGVERWVSFASTPVTLDGELYNLSILTDITDQRLAEERMRELEGIVARSPAVAFTWDDTDGWPIRFVSRSVERYGYDPADLMHERTLYLGLIHPEDRGRVERQVWQSTEEGLSEFDEEYRLRLADGTYRWMAEHTWRSVDNQSGTRLLQGVLVDIHDRKLAEIELERHRYNLEGLVRERTEELVRVNEELEEASKAKSQLLANMSHELRTPMNSIIGFSGILASGMAGPLNDEQQHQTEMISRSGKQLLGLINDILDLSKVEAGAVEIRTEPIDPCAILDDVRATIEPMAALKGLSLSVDAGESCSRMTTDPVRLRQILLNLAGNAVKFTAEGTISLTVRRIEGRAIEFVVADTGPGIAADTHERIFEAFAQVEPGRSGKPSGTGLGLTISREYARLLGGDITVRSEPGAGSTFTLVLPDAAEI